MKHPTPIACLFVLALPGCRSAEPEAPPYAPRPVVELARWHVTEDGEQIGLVRHLEIQDPRGPLPFYRIEDLHGRWLGHATPDGRFSRRVPFADDEEDLGVWSMAGGVKRLFEASGTVALQPAAVDAVLKK